MGQKTPRLIPLPPAPRPKEVDEPCTLQDLGIEGAQDAQPRTVDFYAGRDFAEGRRAHNDHLISNGQAPIPKGRK